MANVHGFGDTADDGPNDRAMPNPWQRGPASGNADRAVDMSAYDSGMGGGGNDAAQGLVGGPAIDACGELIPTATMRPHHYCLMCCCPCCIGDPCSRNRKLVYREMTKTFLFVVSCIQVLVFFVELIKGGVVSLKDNPSLGPGYETLDAMGAKNAYKIVNDWQVWRLFMPIFLHAGFFHIAFNMFFQLMIGIRFEQQWGWKTLIPVYFAAGVGGNLFSACVSPESLGVGASGADMGIIGGWLAHIIMTWQATEKQARTMQLMNCIIFIVIMVFIGFSKYVDTWAHMGGLIVGFVMGAAYFAQHHSDARVRKWTRWVSLATMSLFFGLQLILLWTVVTPNPYVEESSSS